MKVIARALAFVVLAATLAPLAAHGAEPEKVVVRNRKFTSDGKLEVAAQAGFNMVNYLTSHINLTLGLAYNITENWALELDGGWALGRHTSVATAASDTIIASDPSGRSIQVDDFSDLWRMSWNAVLNVRWTPIYGKLNLAGELPLHFQFYLLLGGGAGGMTRDSLVYCIGNRLPGRQMTCSADPVDNTQLKALRSTAIKPIISAGLGMRFFITQWAGLKIEVRDLSFPDSYRVDIDREQAEDDFGAAEGGTPVAGTPAKSPGFTNLVMAQVGVVFSF